MISLCMIVKDEETNIARCLNSVRNVVDEIIVVDTGSTDKTCQIATECGARVQPFIWNGNFSDARNVSLDLATGDWILFLDADEELAASAASALRQATTDSSVDGYFIKVVNYIGKEGWTECCPDLVFRLFRNRPEYRFHGAIHEQIVDVILEKNKQAKYQIAEDIVFYHYGYMDEQIEEKNKKSRNIQIIENELKERPNDKLLRYHYGVELYRAGHYDMAADQLIQAANGLDPQTVYLPKLLRYIVLSYHGAGKRIEALDTIDLALKFFPDYADLYYYAGVIRYELKDYGPAFDFFKQAISMPEQRLYYAPFSGTRGFRSYYYLGMIAEVFCNEEEALRYYIASLRDNPAFATSLDSIIRIIRAHEDPDYGRVALNKICDFCSPQANLWLANILFNQAAYVLALEHIDKGLQEINPTPEILLWRAICLIQQRRYLEALQIIETYEAGHDLYPHARLNKILCFWFDGNGRKVREATEDLFALGLSQDTGAVIGLLRDTLSKRKFPPVSMSEQGFALLADIIKRALDLHEFDKAKLLLAGLSKECTAAYAKSIGQLFYNYSYFAEAQEYFSMYHRENPTCPDTCFKLAVIHEHLGMNHEAMKYYRMGITADPKDPRSYVRLTRLYDRLRHELLKEAASKYPGNTVFSSMLQEEAKNETSY